MIMLTSTHDKIVLKVRIDALVAERHSSSDKFNANREADHNKSATLHFDLTQVVVYSIERTSTRLTSGEWVTLVNFNLKTDPPGTEPREKFYQISLEAHEELVGKIVGVEAKGDEQ